MTDDNADDNTDDERKRIMEVIAEAKALRAALKALADQGAEASVAQRESVKRLAGALHEAVADAVPERREELRTEIDRLGKRIRSLKLSLSEMDLSASTREELKALLVEYAAEKGALELDLGSDYSGLVSHADADEMERFATLAAKETAKRKLAATWAGGASKVLDVALGIVSKLS